MPSPFACFSSNGYDSTLPRHSHHSSTPPTPPSLLPPLKPRTRGQSMDHLTRVTSLNNKKSPGPTPAAVLRRRSLGGTNFGKGEKVTKAMVGHPTGFKHVNGASGNGLGMVQQQQQHTLAAIVSALESTNTPTLPSPSLSTPLHERTNRPFSLPPPSSRPLTTTTSPTTSPTKPIPRPRPHSTQVPRKAPPPVTASVIRQAGFAAVSASSPAPPLLSHKGQGPLAESLIETSPLDVPSSGIFLSSSSPPESSREEKEQEEKVESALGGYLSDTAKERWDGALRDIEEALKKDEEEDEKREKEGV